MMIERASEFLVDMRESMAAQRRGRLGMDWKTEAIGDLGLCLVFVVIALLVSLEVG